MGFTPDMVRVSHDTKYAAHVYLDHIHTGNVSVFDRATFGYATEPPMYSPNDTLVDNMIDVWGMLESAYYPLTKQGKWVVVQELQNEHTLTCFWLCYLAGSRGGVYERTPGGHRTVSPQRNDLTLHAVPGDGLYFWPALREAGYDDATIDGMREERYANYPW